MEIAVAIFFIVIAAIVMFDSWRIGARWNESGPESGFFPFYVGLLMLISGTIILLGQLISIKQPSANFVDKGQLWHVLQVLIPTAVYVAAIGWLGIYLASAIYLALFMWWIGGYALWKGLPSGAALAVFSFWLFELAFKVPLPKGPLEAALGY